MFFCNSVFSNFIIFKMIKLENIELQILERIKGIFSPLPAITLLVSDKSQSKFPKSNNYCRKRERERESGIREKQFASA